MTQHEGRPGLGLPGGGVFDAIRSVLARLPAEQREIVVLRTYYHLTRDEIGAILGEPVARIDRVFRAALRNLRMILNPPQHASFA